jgi:endogenous inhibitor of DNA gyrase (YacG/DUF329 family)
VTRAKPPRTATRLCATCGTPFTWTSRNPRRRFCDPTCKARWWRVSNRDGDQATSNTGRPDPTLDQATTPTTATSTASTPNAVTRHYDGYVAGYGGDQPPSPVQNCPNCHQPLAVINLLVTPTAAYVNTPSRSVTNHS